MQRDVLMYMYLTVNEPNPLTLDYTKVNIDCKTEATGSIDLIVSGGTGPFTYSWSTLDGSGLVNLCR
jgi:hypothetical protein